MSPGCAQMVELKSERELERMQAAGRLVAEALGQLRDLARPGVRTRELEATFDELLRERGAEPAFKGYRGYPGSICTSVNEEVVHGIPGARRLAEGDLLSLDVGVRLDGYYGDAALTVPVAGVAPAASRLLATGKRALEAAIAEMQPGRRLRDVAAAIERTAKCEGFSVVRQFVGHGIGRRMHEDPQVPNFVDDGSEFDLDLVLRPGLVLALEPMVNAGAWEVEVLGDGWTVVTKDRRLSVHFEHTVAVTENGPQVLTCLPDR